MQYEAIGTCQAIARCRTTRASLIGRFTSAAAIDSAVLGHHIQVYAPVFTTVSPPSQAPKKPPTHPTLRLPIAKGYYLVHRRGVELRPAAGALKEWLACTAKAERAWSAGLRAVWRAVR